MRQQLNEIKLLDQYILRELRAEDKLLFDARMILSPMLRNNYHKQLQLHKVIMRHGRERLREQLNNLHSRLMQNQSFEKEILSYFK